MDDYNVNLLSEAKNEYSSRLVTLLTPLLIEGVKSIYDEAVNLCKDNEEYSKYLMTFQNFLSRVPKWNVTIIEKETDRIIEQSGCNYLEDLISCVHITQLKVLTSIRVSQQQKKIDINIPKVNDFIHKCYIELARKIYKNVYLFEDDILPLQYQKNMRECEILCQQSILNIIRNSMPIESILRAYIDETVDEEIIEELVEKNKEIINNDIDDNKTINDDNDNKTNDDDDNKTNDDIKINKIDNGDKTNDNKLDKTNNDNKLDKTNNDNKLDNIINNTELLDDIVNNKLNNTGKINIEIVNKPKNKLDNHDNTVDTISNKQISFNNNDSVLDMGTNNETIINAPKDIPTLEKISDDNHRRRKLEEEDDDDDDDDEVLKISNTSLSLGELDVHDINKDIKITTDSLLTDIELL